MSKEPSTQEFELDSRILYSALPAVLDSLLADWQAGISWEPIEEGIEGTVDRYGRWIGRLVIMPMPQGSKIQGTWLVDLDDPRPKCMMRAVKECLLI